MHIRHACVCSGGACARCCVSEREGVDCDRESENKAIIKEAERRGGIDGQGGRVSGQMCGCVSE